MGGLVWRDNAEMGGEVGRERKLKGRSDEELAGMVRGQREEGRTERGRSAPSPGHTPAALML